MWWKKRISLNGSVYFKGALVPSLESLEGLSAPGFQVTRLDPPAHAVWAAKLTHPSWGSAEVLARRDPFALPDLLVDNGPGLTDSERVSAKAAHAQLFVSVTPPHDDVLRDRKALLRFLSALLGDDGVIAVDGFSQLLWTRARLDDELAHDAPLDISQIHILHCLGDQTLEWVHSHGLSEIGFRDFDVLLPNPELMHAQFDLLRTVAHSIVEGKGDLVDVVTGQQVELVAAETFMRDASSEYTRLRESTAHTEGRVVLCEPRSRQGLFGRMFSKPKPQPSRLLRDGMDPERHLVQFTHSATELTSIRARETVHLLPRLTEELRFVEPTPLVKLGYVTDGAASELDKEHLWFQVHGVRGDSIDATLLNQPFRVSSMHEGERREHGLDKLTDWSLMTPLGQITPRTLELARKIRENRERIAAALARAASS